MINLIRLFIEYHTKIKQKSSFTCNWDIANFPQGPNIITNNKKSKKINIVEIKRITVKIIQFYLCNINNN